MNILLIDDDRHLLKFLNRPLAKHGHSIVEAHNGREGLDLFRKHPDAFDVIVTDIEMPVLTGVDLLKKLREKDYDIPVVVMTGHEDIQFSIEVLRLGAFDFLLKPFTVRKLLDILMKVEALRANRKKSLKDLSCFSDTIKICIPSRTRLIASVVSFLQDRVRLFCELHHINVRNVGICLHEALANAVIHGNLEISSMLKNESPEIFESLVKKRENLTEFGERQVHIYCKITPEKLELIIQDQGQGFNHREMTRPDSARLLLTGRGILIITAFMDKVLWNEAGTCITMTKHLKNSKEPSN